MSYDCGETERVRGREGASERQFDFVARPRDIISIYFISRDWVKCVYEIPVFGQRLVFGERI